MSHYIEDKHFIGEIFTQSRLPKGDYDHCVFERCEFANAFLDNQNFIECQFLDCNLSNANVAHSIFNEVAFVGCKMIGLKLETCNDFLRSFSFKDCSLNLASFYGMSLKNISFVNCKLVEADFTEADLTGSCFDDCDLQRAIFMNTQLGQADFRSAYNYQFDPSQNHLKKTKFSKEGALGLLSKFDIEIDGSRLNRL